MRAACKLTIMGAVVVVGLALEAAVALAQSADPGPVMPGSPVQTQVSGPTLRDMQTVPQTSVAPAPGPPKQIIMPGPFGGASPEESAARKAAAATNPNAPRGGTPQSGTPSDPGVTGGDIASDSAVSGTGIQGSVTVGSNGPVCVSGGPCGQPVAATISVQDASGNELAEFTSGDDGSFQVDLQPGTYTLVALPLASNPNAVGRPVSVTVEDGQYIPIDIQYSTGMY